MEECELAANKSGLETIAVKIAGKVCRIYQGLSGTFASFAYNCLEKKVLPGFSEENLVRSAELQDRRLILSVAGDYSRKELLEILDIALLNLVAFPHPGREAVFFIETNSKK